MWTWLSYYKRLVISIFLSTIMLAQINMVILLLDYCYLTNYSNYDHGYLTVHKLTYFKKIIERKSDSEISTVDKLKIKNDNVISLVE